MISYNEPYHTLYNVSENEVEEGNRNTIGIDWVCMEYFDTSITPESVEWRYPIDERNIHAVKMQLHLVMTSLGG